MPAARGEFENRVVAYDCRHYRGDRPCTWHKQNGLVCRCEHYTPLKGHLLIIKLDAMGDVLRTTCLLPVIDRMWPGMRVTWITRPESVPLLENNPYIAEIVPYGTESVIHVAARKFDRVLNPDAGMISATLAAMAKAPEKTGYLVHDEGYVVPTSEAAENWLEMGIFDDLKRVNRRTYQEIMGSIAGLPVEGMRYVLELSQAEKEKGRQHLLDAGADLGKKVVGIHTGGGGRWTQKQWQEERFVELIRRLGRDVDRQVVIVLLGGPREREQNRRIMNRVEGVAVDACCDNTARHLAALIGCCSVVLSGDSLAMHVALAMERRVVVLFGPTSHAEIELFGLGEKIYPDLDCLVCYRQVCDRRPNCMELITVDMVTQAILRQLSLSR